MFIATQNSMSGVSSNRLKDKREKILSQWEDRCLKEVSSAGTAASLALRDSIPIYLDHLSEALSTNRKMDTRSIFVRDERAASIGKQHGADRASNKHYSLTEVIFEYHILREVIFQVLENDGPLQEIQRDIILDSVEQAVNHAAVEFTEQHTEIQQIFVNTLTHDLKSPITAAKMNAQMILRLPDMPTTSTKLASRIIGSLNRLESMIHDLLDSSRLRAGERLSAQFVKCDLDAVLREVIDEMAAVHGDRFIFKSHGTFSGMWGCDGLRRAVENLVGNALKYGSPDTPITVSLEYLKSGIELKVHNEGKPIPENEIPLLFHRYRRSKSAQESTKMGWGLGLTLVKGVVDAQNGRVWVESAEGKGTSFIIEIPFAREEPELSGQSQDN